MTVAIDCQWGDWVEEKCSTSCGNGTKTYTREILVEAQNGGKECKGEKAKKN